MKIWFDTHGYNDAAELFVHIGNVEVGRINKYDGYPSLKYKLKIKLGTQSIKISNISSLELAKTIAVEEIKNKLEEMKSGTLEEILMVDESPDTVEIAFDSDGNGNPTQPPTATESKAKTPIDFTQIKDVENALDFGVIDEVKMSKFVICLMTELGVSFDISSTKVTAFSDHILYPTIGVTAKKLNVQMSLEYVYFLFGYFSSEIMPKYSDIFLYNIFDYQNVVIRIKENFKETETWKKILDIYKTEFNDIEKQKLAKWNYP
jgi:hypothetical protein